MVQPLAHSARETGGSPQTYATHVAEGVVRGADWRVKEMCRFCSDQANRDLVMRAVVDAAWFHDLGKLDPENQAGLRKGRGSKLCWDHVDAGVAHLRAAKAHMAAWLVRSHHAPGLPSKPFHFDRKTDRRLRGCRSDADDLVRHKAQIERTDRYLPEMLAVHEAAVGKQVALSGGALHGLPMRLALSCLVDADHADTAMFDNGWSPPPAAPTRWAERLAQLDAYVAGLPTTGSSERTELRRDFYRACRDGDTEDALHTCEGPVGIGKTTAVTAYLLQRAIRTDARRLFIIAPYTAILSQTASVLRKALALSGESAAEIVAEHHHRADFDDISSRDLATLWTAPVILTTAVQFFETLASNEPSRLRKLHGLPGSVVFLDEAHAALPAQLWAQNWRWIKDLAHTWGCSFVFASGSLARFWILPDVVGEGGAAIADLVPADLAARLNAAETSRVRYVCNNRFDSPAELTEAVLRAPGPRLLIMNTVHSAATMALTFRQRGADVLHLSTALCPHDRSIILDLVRRRLDHASGVCDWTLVATSLMEAGVDVSFRTPFRENFRTASLIQIGGRGNRNSEYQGGVEVHAFFMADGSGIKPHPAAMGPANVLADFFDCGRFDPPFDPAQLVTDAMKEEVKGQGPDRNKLLMAEKARCYPEVAKEGRVIDSETCLVIVDPQLKARIESGKKVFSRDLLAGSVQIWSKRIGELRLQQLTTRREIYWWPHEYDPAFLGYMAGGLKLHGIETGEALFF